MAECARSATCKYHGAMCSQWDEYPTYMRCPEYEVMEGMVPLDDGVDDVLYDTLNEED